jgi:TM2 domain-containing membrane protein YozV
MHFYISLNNFIKFAFLVISPTITNSQCDLNNCSTFGGICINNNICKCKDNYTTIYIFDNHQLCNYEKTRKIYCALLELILGFGVGHFYSGRKVNGYLKLYIFSTIYLICYCTIMAAMKIDLDNGNDVRHTTFKFAMLFYICCYGVLLLWQIVDSFIFLLGGYNDGNDIPLY